MTELTTRIEAVERVITEWAGPYKTGEGMTDDECLRRIRAIIEGDARATPAEAQDVERLERVGRLSLEWLDEADRNGPNEHEAYSCWLDAAREYARLRSAESDQ